VGGLPARRKRNNEAALKYFLLDRLRPRFLYGVALIMNDRVDQLVDDHRGYGVSPTIVAVSAASCCGLLFKVSAHPPGWAPDVYQGSPVPVSRFMSAGPAAAFAIFAAYFHDRVSVDRCWAGRLV